MTQAAYRERQELMDADRLARTLARMAHEIVERHPEMAGTVLIGVRTRGVPLARRLARLIREVSGREPAVGSLDITLYRDDFTTIAAHPVLKATEIPVSIEAKTVILVDDVLYTGRTIRAALDELVDFGRPARIELAVLVDRGHRELPIRADYVGRTVATTRDEMVQVMLRDEDGEDRVVLLRKEQAGRARDRPARARGRTARAQSQAKAGRGRRP